jgi:hypothetical protein
LARVARSDLPTLDPNKIQFYIGGNGMLDASWTNKIARSVAVSTPTVSPTAMVYDEILGRYLMTSFASDSWVTPPIESSLRIMEAPHPWGPWTLLLDENVENLEGDNLTWAFLMPKFTSADGKKTWMSLAGRSPYGLQFMPIYLTTQPASKKEAENSIITGGVVAKSVAGYSGTGYVWGLDTIGKKCEFNFQIATSGVYILQFRYDTSAYRNIGLYVNGQSRGVIKLGKSEQDYTTWTSASAMTWLAAGTNVIGLECVDSLGNINLDYLAIALYSTTPVSDLNLTSSAPIGTATLNFDPVPGLTYQVDWNKNLSNPEAWQTLTDFVSTGSHASISSTNSSPVGFFGINVHH